MLRHLFISAFAVLLGSSVPLAARAADSSGTGVARLSVVDGDVTVQRGDSNGFTSAAVLNTPVLGADYVTTGNDAHAELQFDGTTSVRLNSDVQLRLVHVDVKSRELQLAAGTIAVRLLRGTDGSSTIDTPSISIRPVQSGNYRITVTAAGETDLTVRAGSVDVDTPQGTQTIAAGTTLVASGTADAPQTSTHEAIAFDDFDRFNGERDRIESRALQAKYVSADLEGASDLDQYGRWVDDGRYGHVWIPASTGADWSPYRDGRWVWEDGYGWTWVAAEPWGWAPYHYGRWYHSPRYGWAWYPPAPSYAPVYSPALVAFFSFGQVGFGFGNICWVPLAPYEPYSPYGWGSGNTTIVNNVTNVTVVNGNTGSTGTNGTTPASLTPTTGNYRNTLVKNAVVGVSVAQFRGGRFEHPVAIGNADFRRATVVRGVVPIVPTTANLRYSMHALPPQVSTRPAFTRSFAGTAQPIARVPFEQQRRSVENVVQRTAIAPRAVTVPAAPPATLRQTQTVPPVQVAHPTAVAPPSDPWSRFHAARGDVGGPTRTQAVSPAHDTTHESPNYATPRRASVVPVAEPPRRVAPTADRAVQATTHETAPMRAAETHHERAAQSPPSTQRRDEPKDKPARKPGA